jgi:4-oxalocrotonate tautomerase
MPHVIIKMVAGRSARQKRDLTDRIVLAVMETLDHQKEAISVAIEEFDPDAWFDRVYDPEIAAHQDRLTQKPGYGSLA